MRRCFAIVAMARSALVALCLVSCCLVASAAGAQETRFGLSDPELIRKFEAELNLILLSPPVPDSRTVLDGDGQPEDPAVRAVLEMDPGLAAAWRADPAQTLKLIERIRGEGGLLE